MTAKQVRVTDDSKTGATGKDDGGRGEGEEDENALFDFSIDNIILGRN